MMTAPILSAVSLLDLLAGVAVVLEPRHDRAVTGLSLDSRTVNQGGCFVGLKGTATDGRRFVGAALARGAAAVLIEDESPSVTLCAGDVPVVGVPDLRRRVGVIAARFFGEPSQSLRVVGVTGTNGKTSVTHLIAHALNALPGGGPCGVIGTIGWGLPGRLDAAVATTPDAVTLQSRLRQLLDAGARATAVEVSSHGLHQHRIAGTRFAAAVFTNLTRDHLDYHESMRAYGDAKRQLFQTPGLGAAVLNLDDSFSVGILETLPSGIPVFGYAIDTPAECGREFSETVRAGHVAVSARGLEIEIMTGRGHGVIRSRLLGRFNVSNLLAAFTTLLALGVDLDDAIGGLETAPGVPGRMERLGGDRRQPLVIVDYAHTPDGLIQALRSARELCRGRLWCVFGCGGNRDPGKRPLMGAAACALSDMVMVTSDNPRDDDPQRIIDDIMVGATRRERVRVNADREQAIRETVSQAGPDDVVLIAGKGHETCQEICGRRLPFSDRAVVLAALRQAQEGRQA